MTTFPFNVGDLVCVGKERRGTDQSTTSAYVLFGYAQSLWGFEAKGMFFSAPYQGIILDFSYCAKTNRDYVRVLSSTGDFWFLRTSVRHVSEH